MTPKAIERIAIVGFGEVGGIFARDLAARGLDVAIYDILLHSPAACDAMVSKAQAWMREAAEAVRDVGMDPHMARATAERQDWLVAEIAERQLDAPAGKKFSWRALADAIAAAKSNDAR